MKIRFALAFCIVLFSPALLPASRSEANQPQAKDEPSLTQGRPFDRKLTGGEAHQFSLLLKTGQFARVVVTQQGIDIVIRLLDASGNELASVDSPNGDSGDEVLFIVAQTGGTFRIEVSALDNKAAAAKYRIELKEVRTVTAADEKRLAAQRGMNEGIRLREHRNAETHRQAIRQFNAVVNLWLEIGELQQAAHSLMLVGWMLADIRDKTALWESLQRDSISCGSRRDSEKHYSILWHFAAIPKEPIKQKHRTTMRWHLVCIKRQWIRLV